MLVIGRQIAAAVGGELLGSGLRLVRAAVVDHRLLSAKLDAMFVALKGERTDGHRFVSSAARFGASAALIDRAHKAELAELADDMDLIVVDDVCKALWILSAANRSSLELPVVAITGSSGKTSTKNMLQGALSGWFGEGCFTHGNMNNLLGVPLTLVRLGMGDKYLIVELGSNAVGEIARLAELVRPLVGIVTCVGGAHLEGLGDVEGVLSEKSALPEAIPEEGHIVIPSFDERLMAESAKWAGQVLTFGYAEDDFVRILDESDGTNAAGTLSCRGELLKLTLPTPGVFNIRNAAAAVAASVALGVPPKEAAEGVQGYEPEKMRMEKREVDGVHFLVDAYNANPDSMKVALSTLAVQSGGRRIAVLGKMLELGIESEALHQQVGAFVVESGIDTLVAVGRESVAYVVGARSGVQRPELVAVDTHAEAACWLFERCSGSDVVLLKGSRGARMEEVFEEYRKLSDSANAEGR